MKKLLIGILLVFLLGLAAASAVITTDPDISTDDIWIIDEDLESTITITSDDVIVVDYADDVDQFDITSEGVIIWTPTNDDVGSFEVTIDALDAMDDIVESYPFTVTVENVNDEPTFTSLAVTDATEDSVYTYDITVEDVDGDSLTIDFTTTLPSWLTLTDNGDNTATLTGIPLDEHVGDNDVVLTVTDGEVTAEQSFPITVENIAPVWDISNMDTTVIEDVGKLWDLDDYVDDNSLIIIKQIDSDLADEDFLWIASTHEFTLTEKVEPGVYRVIFTADDGEYEVDKEIDFLVLPEKCSCKEGSSNTKVEITNIEIDEDELQPGETIDLEVEVANKDADDSMDITVEVYLYDVTKGKKLLDAEEEQEIDFEESEVFDFELELPVEGLDPSHEYRLFLKAYEDEDVHCDEETKEIEIRLEDHIVILESFILDKSTAQPGDLVEATIKVRNIGENDEDVVIILKASDLSLDKSSEEFKLEKYGKGKDDDSIATKTIRFAVPTDAKAGSYSLELIVEYDDGDESEEKFTSLIVSVPGSEVEIKTSLPSELKTGQTYTLPIEIINNGDYSMVDYIVTVEGDWFEPVTLKVITVDAGKTETVNFVLEITESGAQTGKVAVKDDNKVVKTKDFLVDVKAGGLSGITGGFAGAFKDSSAFWIIGDIVLVIVAIFFLKLIFSSGNKHQPVEEIKL